MSLALGSRRVVGCARRPAGRVGRCSGPARAPSTAKPAPQSTAKPAPQPAAKPAAEAAAVTPPAGTNADTGWPRTIALKTGTAVWYQPQIESWADQKHIVAWSAVSYLPTGAKEPALGTIKLEGADQRVRGRTRRAHGPADHRVQLQDAVAGAGQDAGRRGAGAPDRHERVIDLDRVLAYVSDSPLAGA